MPADEDHGVPERTGQPGQGELGDGDERQEERCSGDQRSTERPEAALQNGAAPGAEQTARRGLVAAKEDRSEGVVDQDAAEDQQRGAADDLGERGGDLAATEPHPAE